MARKHIQTMEDAPFYPSIPGYSLIDHSRASARNAISLAMNVRETHGISINMDYLIAGTILHERAHGCSENGQ